MEKKKRSWFSRNLTSILLVTILVLSAAKSINWRMLAFDMIETNIERINEIDIEKQRADSLQAELDTLHVLSWENVEYWIDTLGIDHPEIVKQQVMLETGMLSSAICHGNNNLFGMKEPRVRETTALGTKRGHAYYRNYIDSIKDYKLWQDNMYNGGDYYAFLSSIGYAEARHYITALKNI